MPPARRPKDEAAEPEVQNEAQATEDVAGGDGPQPSGPAEDKQEETPGPQPGGRRVREGVTEAETNVVAALERTAAGEGDAESIQRLIEEAPAFFDVPSHVAAGAFHHLAAYEVTELTRDQGRAVIEAWLESPVQ